MENGKIKTLDRDAVLEILSNGLDSLKNKIDNGRVRDNKVEKVKIEQYRALIYGCVSYNTILKDKQIDDMTKDIETIKSAVIVEKSTEYEPSEKEKEEIELVLSEFEEIKGGLK